MSGPPREISISQETIRLGQLLKLAGVIGSGAEVKALLAGGAVTVNGTPESRRGRQLHPGDLVAVDREPPGAPDREPSAAPDREPSGAPDRVDRVGDALERLRVIRGSK